MTIKQKLKKHLKKTSLFNRYLEFREDQKVNNPVITDLILYANSFCNAKCKMCDVGTGRLDGIRRPLLDTPKYLGMPLLGKIFNDGMFIDRKLFVNFLMTEPLLTPDLPEMLKLCKSRGHWVKITTNGFLLKKRASEIAGHIDNVQVSLDGLESVHDSVRGRNFFSSAIEGIRTLRAINSNTEIEINYTVSNLNYFQLYDFLVFMDNLGVNINLIKFQFLDFVNKKMADEHNRLYPDIPQTTSSQNDTLDFAKFDFNELRDQIDRVKGYQPENILRVAFKPAQSIDFTLEEYYNDQGQIIRGLDKCFAPWTQVAINTAGDVFWHMRCFNDYVLGNVKETGLQNIFLGNKAAYFRGKLKESSFCFPACSRCCGLMPMESVTP